MLASFAVLAAQRLFDVAHSAVLVLDEQHHRLVFFEVLDFDIDVNLGLKFYCFFARHYLTRFVVLFFNYFFNFIVKPKWILAEVVSFKMEVNPSINMVVLNASRWLLVNIWFSHYIRWR